MSMGLSSQGRPPSQRKTRHGANLGYLKLAIQSLRPRLIIQHLQPAACTSYWQCAFKLLTIIGLLIIARIFTNNQKYSFNCWLAIGAALIPGLRAAASSMGCTGGY